MKNNNILVYYLIIGIFFYSNILGMVKDIKRVSVIIVGHGAPANDFPKLNEYFKLHDNHTLEADEIENELRRWPRNEKNDPYWAGFVKIIEIFKNKFKEFHSVHYAFNEMCAPSVREALEEALSKKPDLIIVTSIMFTPGGGHSEKDIPATIELFQEEHPDVKIVYAWPYSKEAIADFIYSHLLNFIVK
ncbi:sirohydrochlorin chelatase [Rosettibacter firmus]|uniref:sirohydrochlorin chelatase n=1 Tax=Rosettibacter firmus TaxID=3111522 RepID=UPI00336BFC47